MNGPAARLAAVLVAAVAWTGLIVQGTAVFRGDGTILGTLWILSAYFTILTNLLVGFVFTGLALGWRRPKLVAGTMLAILLVGIVNAVLLNGLANLFGNPSLDDVLLHDVTPVLVLLFWLIFVPKGALSTRDPLLWAIYPLAYLAYALVRGSLTGRYPYPFIDVGKLGLNGALANAGIIALGFMASGWLVVLLDRSLRRPV